MEFETVLEISPIRVEVGSTRIRFCSKTLRLRRFQEEVVEVFRESIRGRKERSGFLLSLEAPTGAGKTLTLLAPLIAAVLEGMSPGHGSIGVYPSRELAWDQFESIASLLERLGCREEKLEGIGGSEYVRVYNVCLGDKSVKRKLTLAYVTSESIEKLLDVYGGTSKREALEKLANLLVFGRFLGEPSIVFTVPEYPYLLLEAAYRDFHSAGYWISEVARCFSKALSENGFSRDSFIECIWGSEALRRSDAREYLKLYTSLVGDTIFFDEFHAYDSLSLPAFQALAVAALVEHRGKARIVVSSATPQDKNIELVRKIAEKLGYKIYTVRAKWSSNGGQGDVVRRSTRLVIHYYVPTRSGAAAYYEAQRKVVDEAPRIVKDLLEKARKVVVFVDRVSNVYAVAEKLYTELGLKSACITSYRKLKVADYCSEKSMRDPETRVVVGNEAISYGIDVPELDAGIIYARDAYTFIQRLGRIGRGAEGPEPVEVHVFLPLYAVNVFGFAEKRVDYREFCSLAEKAFPQPTEARAGLLIETFRLIVPIAAYAANAVLRSIDMVKSADVKTAIQLEVLEDVVRLLGDKAVKLVRMWTHAINLTPEGYYHATSIRAAASVNVCIGSTGECGLASLAVTGRNFQVLGIQNGRMVVEVSKRPTRLVVSVKEAESKSFRKNILEVLDGLLVPLRLFVELVEKNFTMVSLGQDVGGRITPWGYLDKLLELGLGNIPTIVRVARDRDDERYFEYIASVGEALPIVLVNMYNEVIETIGLLWLL